MKSPVNPNSMIEVPEIVCHIEGQKKIEEQLSESEQRYRMLFESNPQPMWVFDNETLAFLAVNDAAVLSYGYSRDEFLRMTIKDIRPSEDLPELLKHKAKLFNGIGVYESSRTWRHQRKDGTLIDVEVGWHTLEFAGRPAKLVLARDVTERKQAELQLAERARIATLGADVGIALTRGDTLRASLQKCTEAIFEHLDAAFACIWTLNENEQVLELQASSGMYTHIDDGHARVPVGKFMIGLIAQERRPHLTNAVIGDSRVGEQEWAKREGIVAFAGYPLIVGDQMMGVMAMFARQPLTDFALDALTSIADSVALGIARKLAVTELLQLNAQLENERQRLSSIITNVPGIVWEIWRDPDPASQRVDFVSDYVKSILGYTTEEWLSAPESWLSMVHPSDRDQITKEVAGNKAGRSEFRMIAKDGRVVWVETQAIIIYDDLGRSIGARGVTIDITERKRMEAERQVISEIMQGVNNTSDLNELLRLVHLSIAKLLYAENCFVALYDEDRDLMDFPFWVDKLDPCPEPRPLGVGFSGYVVRTGQPMLIDPQLTEKMYKRGEVEKSGSSSRSWLGVPLRTPTKIIGALVLQHYEEENVYDKKDLEFLASAGSQIALAIERKRAETNLRETEERLLQSQKMESIGKLAGGIAHDFNNLMTAVTGYSELALRSLEGEDSLRYKIEEIKKAGERAASLTRQLLAFSRKQVLQPRVIDLNSVVTGMARMLARMIGEHIDLRLELNSSLGQIKADPGQIEQVLLNLAVNARDAMPNGGSLSVATQNIQLSSEAARSNSALEPGQYVMLSVSDSGCGMDSAIQSQIFEPFFTTKEVGKGTGLGLSTVYGIVKQSGGYIWVYSEVGQGTSFKIYLPRIEEAMEETANETEVQRVVRGTETILLVEDEQCVRDLAQAVLEDYGYSVIAASNGREGLDLARDFAGSIDLVVTDVIMPQMGGREMAERLKELRSDTKVLFVSGFTDDAILDHGVLDEDVFFMQKPFSPDALAMKAREILDQV